MNINVHVCIYIYIHIHIHIHLHVRIHSLYAYTIHIRIHIDVDMDASVFCQAVVRTPYFHKVPMRNSCDILKRPRFLSQLVAETFGSCSLRRVRALELFRCVVLASACETPHYKPCSPAKPAPVCCETVPVLRAFGSFTGDS